MGSVIRQTDSFSGGIHIPEYKELTQDQPIEELPVPRQVTVPLLQHLGGPSTPIVKPGDKVSTGQIIAEPSGFISAYIHAPITGTVMKIEEQYHPLGFKSKAIIIKGTEEETFLPLEVPAAPEELTKEQTLGIIKQAGIVGLGGATFPTHVKLSPPPDKNVHTLVINAAECEPYLNVDNRIMIERTEDFMTGIRLIMKLLGVDTCRIGIEDNKPRAIEALEKAAASDEGIYVHVLPTHYPQGGEKQLIYAILKKEVPSGKLPFEVGVVVQNVATVIAIYEAIYLKKPLIDKTLTVSGDNITSPKNVKVRIGTSFSEIIEYCGGPKKANSKIVMGGPMMGFSLFTDQVPAIKGTSGILLFSEEMGTLPPMQPCIYCGRCVEACPMGLTPVLLSKNIRAEQFDQAADLSLMDCIECGCCNYVCPANRPLLQLFKYGKLALRKRKG